MMQLFGQTGHFVRTIDELQSSLNVSLANTSGPSIINVIISPQSERKAQSFNWLTESKL